MVNGHPTVPSGFHTAFAFARSPDPPLSDYAHTNFIRPPLQLLLLRHPTNNVCHRRACASPIPILNAAMNPRPVDDQLQPYYFKTLSNVSPRTLPPRIDVLTFWMNPSRLRRRSSAASTTGQPDSPRHSQVKPPWWQGGR
jgi:hypothetical protein